MHLKWHEVGGPRSEVPRHEIRLSGRYYVPRKYPGTPEVSLLELLSTLRRMHSTRTGRRLYTLLYRVPGSACIRKTGVWKRGQNRGMQDFLPQNRGMQPGIGAPIYVSTMVNVPRK